MNISILKASFISSLVGILILLIIANSLQPRYLEISEITLDKLDSKVTIKGEVTKVVFFNESNFYVINVKDSSGEIKVTLNLKEEIEYLIGKNVKVSGQVQEYESELQIQANKITIVS